ncbi:hypothetical protein J2X65_001792 [Ancylobacter sp. 3268]|uniref:hypothetical protein n=1 Tax=Ancylobacter sp. 3268 TaxID=2817752 RepID=UPI002864E830|nr:hypothetical protein [Ancylobacter sp. 3268]MDR6952437.1 hypothetical protein [Ancylobacter sp. 3268]
MMMLRPPPAAAPAFPPNILTEVEEPLGRDLGRDSDLNRAAVAIFGLAGLAIVAVASAWLMLRGEAPSTAPAGDPLLGGSFEHENAAVAADAPMLRPASPIDDGPGPGAFTLMDAATGLREVVEVLPPGGAPVVAR